MKYFCIDTSGALTAVGAVGERKVYRADDGFVRASRALMPMIDSVLAEAGLKPSKADFIGVVIGPGSFTGIRIGVSTARALSYALDIPIVPVNSCELAAYNSRCSGKVLTVSDAGNGFVYTATYEDMKELSAPSCIRAGDLDAYRAKVSPDAIAADDMYAKILNVEPTRGDGLIGLCGELFDSRHCAYSEAVPLYVRRSQAEEGT